MSKRVGVRARRVSKYARRCVTKYARNARSFSADTLDDRQRPSGIACVPNSLMLTNTHTLSGTLTGAGFDRLQAARFVHLQGVLPGIVKAPKVVRVCIVITIWQAWKLLRIRGFDHLA